MSMAMTHLFMQDRLSTEGCFVLCDANVEGMPICYTSVGFVDLFGYSMAECNGTKCGNLVGRPNRAAIARITGLAPAEIAVGLDIQKGYISDKCRDIASSLCEGFACAVLANEKKNGELVVNELVMFSIEHPKLRHPYVVGLQKDVSAEVSLGKLFVVASADEYRDLIEDRRSSIMERMSRLVGGKSIADYLSEKAADVWQATESKNLSGSIPELREDTMKSLNGATRNLSKSTCVPSSVGTSEACSQAKYKEPEQTVLCFDWDDTLFPTTQVFKRWELPLDSVTEEQERELKHWRQALMRYLTVACRLSAHVVVVTNSKYPWVQRCIKRFAPEALPLFKDGGGQIDIVYATIGTPRGLPVIDPLPETLEEFDARQTEAKVRAMQTALEHCYSQYPGQSWKNIVSIGDMPYEHDALQEIAFRRDSPKRERLKTKLVTTAGAPSLAYMSLMHDVMTSVLPLIVGLGHDMDLDLSHSSSVLHKLGEALELPEIALLAKKHAWRSAVELCRRGYPSGKTKSAIGLWSGLDELETIVHSELME